MKIGTPLSPGATRVMLLGAGELGKEVIIALQRLGVEVVAVDRYAGAPGHQVAHRAHVIDMADPAASRALQLTMNREGIRRLAVEELERLTSRYAFADDLTALMHAIDSAIGYPCVVKPVMSSSGKGQSVVNAPEDVAAAWDYAMSAGRGAKTRVIVEQMIEFDYEITLLTVRAVGASGAVETFFCEPIGHVQVKGDYVESWQPHYMPPTALAKSRAIAERVTTALGGRGIFGVELFVKGDQVWFSEVSPRPHDTGMVTMASQDFNEFELHARAILGLPVSTALHAPGASAVIYGRLEEPAIAFEGVDEALRVRGVDVRLFGKPESFARRRMGVVLARGADVAEARARAQEAVAKIRPVSGAPAPSK